MNEIKLLPCPFCDGEAKMLKFPHCERKYVVICEKESCMASVGVYSITKEDAINKWNTRKPMERIVERLKELTPDEECFDYEEDYIYANERHNKYIEIVKEVGGIE